MRSKRLRRDSMLRFFSLMIGIALSVILSYIAFHFDLPIYPDAIGTMGVSFLCGIFPGIMAAVFTDVASVAFNQNALYFSIVNVVIAICSAVYARRKSLKKAKGVFVYILTVGVISGLLSGLIQWGLFQQPQNASLAAWMDTVLPNAGIGRTLIFLLINILLNTLEKGVSFGIVMLILHFIPDELKIRIENSIWRQNPLSAEETMRMDGKQFHAGISIRRRMTVMMTVMSLAVAATVGVTGVQLYHANEKNSMLESGYNAVEAAAMVIDADRIGDYLREGRNAPGYQETEDLLSCIWKSASDVEYLYVLTVEEDHVTFVFDVEDPESDDDVVPFEPGETAAIDEAFKPYMPALLSGEEIEPIESNGVWSWILTVYQPLRNSAGETVCYIGADVSLNYLAEYMEGFAFRALLIIAGCFVMIVAYGLWTTRLFFIFPMKSMTGTIGGLIEAGTDQDRLDAAVKNIRHLDISTGDELERLYQEICDMASNQAEQLRSVQRLADNTAKMQDGLIITMADMVENRDSDTGAHIQKTAAYVKIIVEGLKKKGFYPEKITGKFMADVVRSAPLHDVGKINIPDNVLNKPGKLTDEEYTIMKTHTTAGKRIIERAISTMEGDSYLREARNMAGYHHERWDGRGYPEGLHGEMIPLSARIMSVADVFDALTAPRVYKPAFPLEKALSIIDEGKGTQFDPKCVEVFMDSLDEVKAILLKFQDVQ